MSEINMQFSVKMLFDRWKHYFSFLLVKMYINKSWENYNLICCILDKTMLNYKKIIKDKTVKYNAD